MGRAKAAGSTHVPRPKTTTAASLHNTASSNHFRPSSSAATQKAVELLGAATHGEGVCISLGYRATSTLCKEKRSWVQSHGFGYRVRVLDTVRVLDRESGSYGSCKQNQGLGYSQGLGYRVRVLRVL